MLPAYDIAYTFLITLSVSKIISSLINGTFPVRFTFSAIIIAAWVFLVLNTTGRHSDRKKLSGSSSAILSRDFFPLIFYSVTASSAAILQLPFLLILSSLTGLTMLLSIDREYFLSYKYKSVLLHSGQTFITGLLIVSFLTGRIVPFVFIATIKLAASFYTMRLNLNDTRYFGIRFLRSALLITTGMSLVVNNSYTESLVVVIFIAGELMDRILFYIDIKPFNLS